MIHESWCKVKEKRGVSASGGVTYTICVKDGNNPDRTFVTCCAHQPVRSAPGGATSQWRADGAGPTGERHLGNRGRGNLPIRLESSGVAFTRKSKRDSQTRHRHPELASQSLRETGGGVRGLTTIRFILIVIVACISQYRDMTPPLRIHDRRS